MGTGSVQIYILFSYQMHLTASVEALSNCAFIYLCICIIITSLVLIIIIHSNFVDDAKQYAPNNKELISTCI